MINKNKFSIKDTKKVLHKVGKKWVVVSAVLLGLAAGGAAVTTANADQTNAQDTQPTTAQQVTKNANMSAANHSFGAADPANTNGNDSIRQTISSAASSLKNKADGYKAKAHQYVSNDVNLTNVVKLANRARVNHTTNAYADLVNLANNDLNNIGSEAIGKANANSNSNSANTLFSTASAASNYISTLKNTGSDNAQLDNVPKAFSDANNLLNSSISVPVNSTITYTVTDNFPIPATELTNLHSAANDANTKLTSIKQSADTFAAANPGETLSDAIIKAGKISQVATSIATSRPNEKLSDFRNYIDNASNDLNDVMTDGTYIGISSGSKLKDVQAAVDNNYETLKRVVGSAKANTLKNDITAIATSHPTDTVSYTSNNISDIETIISNPTLNSTEKLSNLSDDVNNIVNALNYVANEKGVNKNGSLSDAINIATNDASATITSLSNMTTVPETVSLSVNINSTVSTTAANVINSGFSLSGIVNSMASNAFASTVNSLKDSTANDKVMSNLTSNINNNQIPHMLDINIPGTNKTAYQSLSAAGKLPNVTEASVVSGFDSYLSASTNGIANSASLSTVANDKAKTVLGNLYNINIPALYGDNAGTIANELTSGGSLYNDINDVLPSNSSASADSLMAKASNDINMITAELPFKLGHSQNYNNLRNAIANLPSATNNINSALNSYKAISSDVSALCSTASANMPMFISNPQLSAKASKAISFVNDHFGSSANSMYNTLNSMSSASTKASSAIHNAKNKEYNEEVQLLSSGNNNVVSNLNSGISDYMAHVSGAYTSSLATDTIEFVDPYENNSQISNTTTMTGLSGSSFNATSSALNIPNGYQAVSSSNITFDGTSHDFDVALSNVTDTINFIDKKGSKVGSTTSNGVEGSSVNVNSLQLPTSNKGKYKLGNNNDLKFTNNKTLNVNVVFTPNSHKKQPVPVNPNNPVTPNNNQGTNTNEPMNNNTNINSFASSSVAPSNESASVEPNTSANTSSSATSKKHVAKANYVKVNKALQLHTNANFTKKNAYAVVKPGTTFKIEKAVKAHNGALRYEVKYNKGHYFITANKRWTSAYYKSAKHMSNVNNYVHYRYAKVGKALQLHTSPNFTKRNGVMVVRPGTEFRINRVVKSHGLVRYEVRYNHKNYFITANKKFSSNAYVQKHNFRKHGYKAVRVVKPLNEYRKLNFAKRSFIRHFYRGSVLPVKKVITIAHGEMTRLELTNGRYVTANKNFVEPIR